MEIRIYTIKLNPPQWVRNVILYALLPAGALFGGALAVRAGVTLTTFAPNTPIRSADVNQNFSRLNNAIAALQTSSALLYGVAGPLVAVSNGVNGYSTAACGSTGRVVTGFCVTNPLQATGSMDSGLWKAGPYDASFSYLQSAVQPVLSSTWVCDVKAANGVTVQAYAICMNAP